MLCLDSSGPQGLDLSRPARIEALRRRDPAKREGAFCRNLSRLAVDPGVPLRWP